MYISLSYNFDRKFRGNQNYELESGEISVRDDDTTYIYKEINRADAKELKRGYRAAVESRGVFAKISGSYPYYTCDITIIKGLTK
jgi:hypothetical protein